MRIEEVWPEWHESELLGEGSFGKVFKATREEFGETFYSAIKVLSVPKSSQDIRQERAQGMSDLEIHAYFQSVVQDLVNEIVLMENLKGASNIVSIDDYRIIERENEIGWDIFIRMELLTPFDVVINSPDFSVAEIIKMGIDICSALEVCEYNNIVHRDIKPDNIFISKYGEYKLGDFGISRQLDKTQANMSRKGTLNFMAPEVYKGESYGSSVDTYSLGLVMYKLLNKNRLPFIDSDKQNLKYNERQEAFERRIRGEKLPLISGVSNSINYILQKACAFNPDERYYSATEFKNDLAEELNNLVYYGMDEKTIIGQEYYADSHSPYESTTNDMTSQGQVIYDGNDIEDQAYSISGESAYGNYYANTEASRAKKKNIPKTSKVCRYAAIPISVGTLIFGLIVERMVYTADYFFISMLSMMILTIGRNRKAMGLYVIGFAICQNIEDILTNWKEIYGLSGELLYGDIGIVINMGLIICLLLCFFGGFSMVFQKEARLGGVLCLYSGLIKIVLAFCFKDAFIIGDLSLDFARFGLFLLTAITVFLWSYGYDSQSVNDTKYKKINYVFCYIMGVVGVVAEAIAANW